MIFFGTSSPKFISLVVNSVDTRFIPGWEPYLPYSGEISQVEDVVELGWCGQHLNLDLLPHLASGEHERGHRGDDLSREAALLHKIRYPFNAERWVCARP